jgi:hypothetical protein
VGAVAVDEFLICGTRIALVANDEDMCLGSVERSRRDADIAAVDLLQSGVPRLGTRRQLV